MKIYKVWHMTARESKEVQFTKLEERLLKIHFFGEYIAELRNTVDKIDDDDERWLWLEYSILKLYEFIYEYENLEEYVPENKKNIFETFKPLFCVLLEYKKGLRIYRNKRVAHMDKLNVTTTDFFMAEKLPMSLPEFKTLFVTVEILAFLVDSLFFEYLPRMIERLNNMVGNQKQMPRRDFEKKLKTAKNEVLSKIREYDTRFPVGIFPLIETKLSN